MVYEDWSVWSASTLYVRTIEAIYSGNACKVHLGGRVNTTSVTGAKNERRQRNF